LTVAVDWQAVGFGFAVLVMAATTWFLRKPYVRFIWKGTAEDMERYERLLGFVAGAGVVLGIAMIIAGSLQ
jgi:hypothetical protein